MYNRNEVDQVTACTIAAIAENGSSPSLAGHVLEFSRRKQPMKAITTSHCPGRDKSPLLPTLRLQILLLWSILLLLPLVTPAAPTDTEAEPIKIAAIFSETGIAAPHNLPLIEMTKLAVKYVNSRGGLLGRPLHLLLFDNGSTPIGSALAARRAVAENVTAVIGAHWSSHSLAMAPILQEAGIPMISPGSTNPEVTRGKDYIFRACFIDSFQGLAMAKFAYDELHAQTAVVITNIDEDYSTMLGQFFSHAFERAGGRVLAEIGYRGTATDFSEIIKEVAANQPEVIYLPGYTRDSGLFIKQSVKMGLKATFLGGDAWDEIEKYAESSVEGSFQSAPWHQEVPFPRSVEMKKYYTATYGRDIVNNSSPLAYDAVLLLAEAISRAGSLDHRAIRDALAATSNFEGATGPIRFNGNGDPIDKAIIIIEFKNGKQIFRKAITP
jgi:branched-chain amino acid transport system substrate-binding protein